MRHLRPERCSLTVLTGRSCGKHPKPRQTGRRKRSSDGQNLNPILCLGHELIKRHSPRQVTRQTCGYRAGPAPQQKEVEPSIHHSL